MTINQKIHEAINAGCWHDIERQFHPRCKKCNKCDVENPDYTKDLNAAFKCVDFWIGMDGLREFNISKPDLNGHYEVEFSKNAHCDSDECEIYEDSDSSPAMAICKTFLIAMGVKDE